MRTKAALAVALTISLYAAFAYAQEDIAKHPKCKFCGMDRQQYATSRVFIQYEDGSSEGLCSLRCAAVEMALGIDRFPRSTSVGDYNTGALLDAPLAAWVIGGNKPGVMTRQPKWAFGTLADAEAFVKANGGTPASYEEAVRTAYTDLYEDTKMIRERREAKRRAAAEKK